MTKGREWEGGDDSVVLNKEYLNIDEILNVSREAEPDAPGPGSIVVDGWFSSAGKTQKGQGRVSFRIRSQ